AFSKRQTAQAIENPVGSRSAGTTPNPSGVPGIGPPAPHWPHTATGVLMTSRKPPPTETQLMARTAEMLALPEMVCRRRDCRRVRRCGWIFPKTREPCCLANLDAEQRRLFDQLLKLVRDARDFGSWDSKIVFASPWRAARDLQDAAVEAAFPLVARPDRRAFRAFVKKRAAQPPPREDGFPPEPQPATAGWPIPQ